MAAQAWHLYNLAKKKLGNATINLASNSFRMTLHTSASNAATKTLGVFASVTNEITSVAASYSSSGKACTSVAWTVGASAQQYKYAVGNVFWSAASQLNNIKLAVLWVSGASAGARHLLAFASLTSTQFNLAAGNRLTIAINASGVFTVA